MGEETRLAGLAQGAAGEQVATTAEQLVAGPLAGFVVQVHGAPSVQVVAPCLNDRFDAPGYVGPA